MSAFIKFIYLKIETQTLFEGYEKKVLTKEPEEIKSLKRKE